MSIAVGALGRVEEPRFRAPRLVFNVLNSQSFHLFATSDASDAPRHAGRARPSIEIFIALSAFMRDRGVSRARARRGPSFVFVSPPVCRGNVATRRAETLHQVVLPPHLSW